MFYEIAERFHKTSRFAGLWKQPSQATPFCALGRKGNFYGFSGSLLGNNPQEGNRIYGEKALERDILIPGDAIKKRVKELARQISIDYEGKELVLIGILNGVIFFFADLVREISIPTRIDFIRAASYGSEMESSGSIRLTKDVEMPVRGKSVVLVEDIVDTGLTLSHIVKNLQSKGTESLRICALIDKPERRNIDVSIDYCGFEIKEGFLVGYGLDYDEKYRYLPDICILK
jgi:hypoxanthine phosphoribosyltransferase